MNLEMSIQQTSNSLPTIGQIEFHFFTLVRLLKILLLDKLKYSKVHFVF